MQTNKRRHDRLLMQADTFAVLGEGVERIGRIRDISMGGLAFEYVEHSEVDNTDVTVTDADLLKSSRVGIFLSGSLFYLPDISCRVIYDVLPSEHPGVIASLKKRRCGVQFDALTKSQASQLTSFIETYTSA